MAVIIYNPKTFEGKPSQPIDFLWEGKTYKLAVNDMAKFDDDISKEMLKRYGFLEEVKPEFLGDIKKRMSSEVYVCEYCKGEFYSPKELQGHMLGKHKLSKENADLLKSIPDDEAVRVASTPKKPAMEAAVETPDSGTTDSDGVKWVGEGVEEDKGGK